MKTNLTRRDFLKFCGAGTVTAAAAAVLTGCGSSTDSGESEVSSETSGQSSSTESGSSGSSESTENIITSSTINEATGQFADMTIIGSMPATLDGGNHGHIWSAHLYETLVAADENYNYYGQLVDDSKGEFGWYDHVAGTTEYDLHLYDYITDSRGNALTANDVVYSLNYWITIGKARNFSYFESIEALDEYTVRFHMTQEMLTLDGITGYVTMRVFTQKSFEELNESFAMECACTGPYVVTDYQTDVSITLEKRDDYWQKAELVNKLDVANVEKFTILKSGETAQSIVALQTGKIDVLEKLGYMNAAPFLAGGEYDGAFNPIVIADPEAYQLYPNLAEESNLYDLNARLAVYYAIDADQITAGMGDGVGVRAASWAQPACADYDAAWESKESYITKTDLDLAKEYLEKSNLKGKKVRILYGNFNANFSTIANIVNMQLMQIGVESEILAYDMANFGAVHGDRTMWDLWITVGNGMSSTGTNASLWFGFLDYNTRSVGGENQCFQHDETLQELISATMYEETHTAENMNKVYDYVVENAQVFPICRINVVTVVSKIIDPASMLYSAGGSLQVNALTPIK